MEVLGHPLAGKHPQELITMLPLAKGGDYKEKVDPQENEESMMRLEPQDEVKLDRDDYLEMPELITMLPLELGLPSTVSAELRSSEN